MPDVFVSYSRQDREFADRLTADLDARRKQAWLDTERIADAEVFPKAIQEAIESAEAFLFVISPNAVASPYCEQEVAYAAALGKRIVPVLLTETSAADIPAEIRTRNWITFTDNTEFDRLMDRIVLALDTDLEQRKEHTRWLIKALEWDREDRDRSFLLRGTELAAAEGWLARTKEHVDPAPTSIQREYLLASRQVSARRQRRISVVSLGIAAISIGLVIVALIARGQANTASAVASSQAFAAESENDLNIDPETSVLLGIRAVQQSPTPSALFALREALDRSSLRLALPNVQRGSCSNANIVATNGSEALYSPDGRQIAEGSCAGEVMTVNASNGRVEWRREASSQVSAVSYSPDGRTLAIGTVKGVELLDPRTGAVRRIFAGPEPSGLAFSRDGSHLADTTNPGVTLWDVSTGSSRDLSNLVSGTDSPSFTPDGRLVISDFALGGAAIVNPTNPVGTSSGICNDVAAPQNGIAVSPIGGFLVCSDDAADGSAQVTVWSTSTLTQEYTLTAQASTAPAAVAVSPDGSLIAASFGDGSGGIWSVSTHAEIVPILGETASINSMVFSPDGRRLLVAAADGSARVYATRGPGLMSFRVTPSLNVATLALSKHRLTALIEQGDTRQSFSIGSCASPGCVVRSWPMSGGGPPRNFTLSEDSGSLAWMSPDGELAAVWGQTQLNNERQYRQSATSIWNINERKVLRTLPKLPVTSVGFSPDHRLIAESLAANGARVFNVSTGRETKLREALSRCAGNGFTTPVFTNDDRLVADTDGCGYVYVWNARTGKRLLFFARTNAYAVAFDPAGDRLAVASNDDTATVLNVGTGRPVFELVGHTRPMNDIVYSPNGKYIATVSVDGTVRIWDARTGIPMRIESDPEAAFEEGETGGIAGVNGVARNVTGLDLLAFSPTSRLLATVSAAGIIRVWDTCSACGNASGLLKLANSRVVEPLTPTERFESSASAIVSAPNGGAGGTNGASEIASPYLGVAVDEVKTGSLLPPSGASVQAVGTGSPAQAAGIQVGDIIVGFNGRVVQSVMDLLDDQAAAVPGQAVPITIYRGERKLTIMATLTSTPLP